jgi:5-methylcytosine-specific restriction endonuclease McrA
VLNKSYFPIAIISAKKAIILIYLNKAEVVENETDKFVTTISQLFPVPSIIRLLYFSNLPTRNIELSKKNIMRRDGMRCQYCGKTHKILTIDHILPKSRGGTDEWENLVTSCIECNNKKGNKTPEEAGMVLLSKPKKPNSILFIKANLPENHNNWKNYLF